MSGVAYLEPHQLAEALRDPQSKSSVVVLDVRDDDFPGGHIAGAINTPSELYYQEQDIDDIIDKHLPDSVNKVVVHCMFSQQRGPRCALRLAQRLAHRGRAGTSVLVLRGGWATFYRTYHTDADLLAAVEHQMQ